MSSKQMWIIVGVIVLAAAVWYYYSQGKKEGYMSSGAMDNLDSLDGRYELIEAPDAAVKSEHFADLVGGGDQERLIQQVATGNVERPLERLEKLQQTQLLPPTAAHLPQYNIDVANPTTYSFAVNAPRVVLKNRLNNQADPIRGDIPIRYHPDVPLIAKSSNGRDSLRLDGLFSDHFASLYNKLTGRAYKNMPLKTSVQGSILDYIPSD